MEKRAVRVSTPRGLRVKIAPRLKPNKNALHKIKFLDDGLPSVNQKAKDALLKSVDGIYFVLVGSILEQKAFKLVNSLAVYINDFRNLNIQNQKILDKMSQTYTPYSHYVSFTRPFKNKNKGILELYQWYEIGFLFLYSLCSSIANDKDSAPRHYQKIALLRSVLHPSANRKNAFLVEELTHFENIPSLEVAYLLTDNAIVTNPDFRYMHNEEFWKVETKVKKPSKRKIAPSAVAKAILDGLVNQSAEIKTNDDTDVKSENMSNIGQFNKSTASPPIEQEPKPVAQPSVENDKMAGYVSDNNGSALAGKDKDDGFVADWLTGSSNESPF